MNHSPFTISDPCQQLLVSDVDSIISGYYVISSGLAARYSKEPVYYKKDFKTDPLTISVSPETNNMVRWQVTQHKRGKENQIVAKSELLHETQIFGTRLKWFIQIDDSSGGAAYRDVMVSCEGRSPSHYGPHNIETPLDNFLMFPGQHVAPPDFEMMATSAPMEEKRNLKQLYEMGAHNKEDFFLMDKSVVVILCIIHFPMPCEDSDVLLIVDASGKEYRWRVRISKWDSQTWAYVTRTSLRAKWRNQVDCLLLKHNISFFSSSVLI